MTEIAPGWAMTTTDTEAGKTEPDTLEEAVGQTIGAASVCWPEVKGVFQDTQAMALADQLIDWVNKHYVSRAGFNRGDRVLIRNAWYNHDRWANGMTGLVKEIHYNISGNPNGIVVHLPTGHDISCSMMGLEPVR